MFSLKAFTLSHERIIGMPYHIFPCTLHYWHIKITFISNVVIHFNGVQYEIPFNLQHMKLFHRPVKMSIYHNLPPVCAHTHNIFSRKHFIPSTITTDFLFHIYCILCVPSSQLQIFLHIIIITQFWDVSTSCLVSLLPLLCFHYRYDYSHYYLNGTCIATKMQKCIYRYLGLFFFYYYW